MTSILSLVRQREESVLPPVWLLPLLGASGLWFLLPGGVLPLCDSQRLLEPAHGVHAELHGEPHSRHPVRVWCQARQHLQPSGHDGSVHGAVQQDPQAAAGAGSGDQMKDSLEPGLERLHPLFCLLIWIRSPSKKRHWRQPKVFFYSVSFPCFSAYFLLSSFVVLSVSGIGPVVLMVLCTVLCAGDYCSSAEGEKRRNSSQMHARAEVP